jgi:cobaltochelatase CobN
VPTARLRPVAFASLLVALAGAAVAVAVRSTAPVPTVAVRRSIVIVGGWDRLGPLLDKQGKQRAIGVRNLPTSVLDKPGFVDKIGDADLYLVLNAPAEATPALTAWIKATKAKGKRIVVLDARPWQGALVTSGDLLKDETLTKYFRASGEKNLARMLDWIGVHYFGEQREVLPPEPVPTDGLYHPDAKEPFLTEAAFEQWYRARGHDANAPRAAYVIHGSFVTLRETEDIDAVIHTLERRGLSVYTVFADKEEPLRKRLLAIAPDLVMTQRHTGLGKPADGSTPIPEVLGVPYLKPIGALHTTVEEWRTRPEGLLAGDIAGQVIAQELEGTIEPLIVSAQRTVGETRLQTPIPERIEHFADRAAAWVSLRRTPNEKKRLAILHYNADLGGGSVSQGSASGMFLDAPASLMALTRALKEAGYLVEPPTTRDALVERLVQEGRNLGPWAQADIDALAARENTVLVPLATYRTWFETKLTTRQQADIVAHHGPPPGKLMVTTIHGEPELVLPRVKLGEGVSLFPQPEKGARQDARLVHDQTAPPSHQYIAMYLWFQEVYHPSALVHFGTHGTLELLPGRAVGLGPEDIADRLLGSIPNVNPWILDNVAEATLARRRAYAVLVDHLVPPIERTDLGEARRLLHEAVERTLGLEAGPVRETYRRTVGERARALSFATDLADIKTPAGPSDATLRELDARFHALEGEQAPRTLHTLGQVPPLDRRTSFVTSILGRPLHARLGGRDRAEAWVACVVRQPTAGEACKGLGTGATEEDRAAVLSLEADLAKTPDEIAHTLAALAGRYVRPGPGNDPVRNPSALPTGRQLYGLNPDEVPSAPAMEVGKLIAQQTIDAYQKAHGVPPHKVAINANGFETMRDTGVTEGQALALLGVEPVRDPRGVVNDVRLLSREELGRPRVDVVLAIGGAYRDNFASRVRLLDKAVQLAEDAPEPDNPLAKDNREAEASLRKAGIEAARAKTLSRIRIYGQPPGQYGTQILHLLPRSGAWGSRDELATVYRENMRFAYGGGLWGEGSDEAYSAALAGTDAVAHTWSSNMMSPLTNHHVYEYLGGLSMSVEQTTGKKPDALIADARDPNAPRTRDLAEVLSAETATRVLNEAWINGMKENGYAGGGHVGAYVENLFGWATTVPGSVDSQVFARVNELYLRDAANRRWLEEKNPDALLDVTSTLLESARRGYYQPTKEERERLAQDYLEQVAKRGLPTGMMGGGNEKLHEFVKETYEAPGSTVPAAVKAAYEARHDAEKGKNASAAARLETARRQANAASQGRTRTITGARMQVVNPPHQPGPRPPTALRWALVSLPGGAFGLVSLGFLVGRRDRRRRRRPLP